MKLHQVKWNVDQPSTIHTRCLSCFCQDKCSCYDHKIFTFPNVSDSQVTDKSVSTDTSVSKDPSSVQNETVQSQVKSADTVDKRLPDDGREQSELLPIDHADEDLIGKWCVVRYDGKIYPGIIKEVDIDSVEVTSMHRIGKNRYFWPLLDDTIWYTFQNVVSMIPKPAKVTQNGRHVQIQPSLYKLISDKLDLD